MQEFTINRDNGASLQFYGELIETESNDQTALFLYRTEKGRFVCHRIDHVNEKSIDIVCDNHAEITDFFGRDDLAMTLYTEAGISVESSPGIDASDIMDSFYKIESVSRAIETIAERIRRDELEHMDILYLSESTATLAEMGREFCANTVERADRAETIRNQ